MRFQPIRPLRTLALALALALPLTACVPQLNYQPRTPTLDLRGPAPDVVILGVSGFCGPPRGCINARHNFDYLTPYGTLDRLADAVASAGLSVQVAGYASGAFDTRMTNQSPQLQRGWVALRRDYAQMGQVWKDDYPRVVMVGHSHGVPWLHGLTQQFQGVPVALQIDLDASCLAWKTTYMPDIWALSSEQRGEPDIADICDPRRVGGQWAWGKDLVWPNVAHNLEVHTGRLGDVPTLLDSNYLWETTSNLRPDGSRGGITTGVSRRERHHDVSRAESGAVIWAAGELHDLALGWAQQAPKHTH